MDITIILAALVLIHVWQNRDLLPVGAQEAAPDFVLSDVDGEPVHLSDFRGQTVMLHFWATWCGVCRAELGSLQRLHERTGDGAVLVTVAVNSGDAETLQAFARERELTFPILVDEGAVASRYRVSAFPTSYYVSPAGQLRSSAVGFSPGPAMRFRLWLAGRDR